MTQGPCWQCTDRKPGCHGSCERYKEWKAPLEKMREEKYKDLLITGVIAAGTYRKNRKWLKKKGHWTK